MAKSSANIYPILLIGCLSMFTGEVLAGSSRSWFIDAWGLLVTFPLYLAHILFFLWLAIKLKKTSLPALYFFGMAFALYESWITKVLWAGYLVSPSTSLGLFMGLSIGEFIVLVFFWHPIMSFIIPLLVFEILSGNIVENHAAILTKSVKKTGLIITFLILISVFVAQGNGFNIAITNLSLLGSILLIWVLRYLSKNSDLRSLYLGKIGFSIIVCYLALLYCCAYFWLRTEKIPQTAGPYLSIIFVYACLILLIGRTKKSELNFAIMPTKNYTRGDISLFAFIAILAANLACLISHWSIKILSFNYALLMVGGISIFITVIYKAFRPVVLKGDGPAHA